jgi:CheY-like chemotaxis protein
MKQTLLVSDDQGHMDRTARILESMGWKTCVATTTELVSEVVAMHRPSLIVADIEMEGGRAR